MTPARRATSHGVDGVGGELVAPPADRPPPTGARSGRELAALMRAESAAERAPLVADTGWGGGHETGTMRVLVFHAEGLVIVLEVTEHDDGLRVHGLVRPVPAGTARVWRRRGRAPAVACDRQGWFELAPIERGPVSLALQVAGPPPARIVTDWVAIDASPARRGEVS